MPVLTNAAQSLRHSACSDREGVFAAVRPNYALALYRWVEPHACQLDQVHRAIPLKLRTHPRQSEEEDAAAFAVQGHPVCDLRHRAAAMQVVVRNDELGRLFEVGDFDLHARS